MNKTTDPRKITAVILALFITAATLLFTVSCNKNLPATTVNTNAPASTEGTAPATTDAADIIDTPDIPAPGSILTLSYILDNSGVYSAHYSLWSDGDLDYEQDYNCNGNILSFNYTEQDGTVYTDYIYTTPEGDTVYYCSTDEGYYQISTSCSHYDEFDLAYFHGLTPIKLTYALSSPELTADKNGDGRFIFDRKIFDINSLCKSIFFDCDSPEDSVMEIFTSLEIEVSKGKIHMITARSEYTAGDDKSDCVQKLVFDYSDKPDNITLPATVETVTDENFNELFGNGDDYYLFQTNPNFGIKSIGQTNALVIPVQFTGKKFSDKMLADLRGAFEGDESTTGWESVQSYYSKSSYGKLNINYTFTDVYDVGMTVKSFEKQFDSSQGYYEYFKPIENIIDSVLERYSTELDLINDYDSNGDHLIDAVYLIYSAPFDGKGDNALWWAWTYYSRSDKYIENESGFVFPGYYIWASCDFIYEDMYTEKSKVKINASTYIHETGHMLGLSDYYDGNTEIGPSGGIGGGDMMDCNVGDHCALSKILLGWTNAKVIDKKDATVQIKDLVTSGDCIVVKKNDFSGIYSEFILIDLFVPESLNKISSGLYGLPSEAMVRIYHVDATLTDESPEGWESLEFEYDNSSTDHKFIKVIECDGDNSIESTENSDSGEFATDSDYFSTGSTFGGDYKWYDGTPISFTLTIDSIDSENGSAVISFAFE